ncbi:MAG: hypothetical protein AAF518_23110 [Spirochaetota bacterium]
MLKLFEFLVIILTFLSCLGSNNKESSANSLMRALTFTVNSNSDTLSLSISGSLSQNGSTVNNTLITTNSSSINTTTSLRDAWQSISKMFATRATETSSEAIRCVDYDLNSGYLTCYFVINTANISGASDGCYHIYYSSSDTNKLKSIATFQSITSGNEITFFHTEKIPTGATGFALFSCNSSTESELTSATLTDNTSSDGVLTDSNGNYSVNIEAGKYHTFKIRRATKDLGDITIDLSRVTTEEGLNELRDTPSKLTISVPTTLSHSVTINGPVKIASTSTTQTTTTSSSDVGSTTTPTIDFATFTTEVNNDSNLTGTTSTATSTDTSTSTSYTISGTISGLTGTAVLQNNSGDDLTLSANGGFTFATALSGGAAYSVTVQTHSSFQHCTVASGAGTAITNVTGISVSCADIIATSNWTNIQSILNTQSALGSSGTETSTSISIGQGWSGAVLADNGKIYGIPTNSTNVPIIDPSTNTVDTSTITVSSSTSKWYGGVLAPNGKIYGIPYSADHAIIIDPSTNTVDTTTLTGYTTTNYKWSSGVLAPDGKIYAIPYTSDYVLIIDPSTNTADTTSITGLGSGGNKWQGGILAPNGKIYAFPSTSAHVLIIDPVAKTADTSTITGFGGTAGKWSGGALAPNGKIYACPVVETKVLIIDPSTDTVDTTSITGLNSADKWDGAILAPNGKIYCLPRNTTNNVLVIDPSNDTATQIAVGDTGWNGGVLAPNGKIYAVPNTNSSSNVLVIDTKSVGSWPTEFYKAGHFNNF